MNKKNAPPIAGATQLISWCIAEQEKLHRQLEAIESGNDASGVKAEEIKRHLADIQAVLDGARRQLN